MSNTLEFSHWVLILACGPGLAKDIFGDIWRARKEQNTAISQAAKLFVGDQPPRRGARGSSFGRSGSCLPLAEDMVTVVIAALRRGLGGIND